MKELIVKILTDLFGEDTEFNVSEEHSVTGSTDFTIEIGDEHKPKLIGKRGRTISAIYNLVNIIAKREGKRININVKD